MKGENIEVGASSRPVGINPSSALLPSFLSKSMCYRSRNVTTFFNPEDGRNIHLRNVGSITQKR
jgi:hypothetical protein